MLSDVLFLFSFLQLSPGHFPKQLPKSHLYFLPGRFSNQQIPPPQVYSQEEKQEVPWHKCWDTISAMLISGFTKRSGQPDTFSSHPCNSQFQHFLLCSFVVSAAHVHRPEIRSSIISTTDLPPKPIFSGRAPSKTHSCFHSRMLLSKTSGCKSFFFVLFC